jgi:hypothetical protein
MVYEIKTKKNNSPVLNYLENIENNNTRIGCVELYHLMRKVTLDDFNKFIRE